MASSQGMHRKLLWGLGLMALVPGLFSEKGDTVLYARYAEQAFAGARFFTQIHIEYPPLNALLFMLPQAMAAVFPGLGYYAVFVALAATADLLQRRALIDVVPESRNKQHVIALSATCAALLFYTYLKRFDIFAAAASSWMLVRLLRNPRDLAAWAIWGLAVSCKLYPLTFAPLCLIYSYQRGTSKQRLMQQAGLGASLIVAIHGFATWYGGAQAWVWLAYMQARGLQLASVYAAFGVLYHGLGQALPIAYGFGCLQVYASWADWCAHVSSWVSLMAVSMTWRLCWRQAATPAGLWRGAAACVAALLLTSKVFSPQYVIWMVPLLAVAAAAYETDGLLIFLTLLLCASTALLFPNEVEIGQGRLFRQLVLLARTAALMVIWGRLCSPPKAGPGAARAAMPGKV